MSYDDVLERVDGILERASGKFAITVLVDTSCGRMNIRVPSFERGLPIVPSPNGVKDSE